MADDRRLNRSAFLRQGLGYFLEKVADGLQSFESQLIRKRFRPPGALPEAEFLSSCQRCTACVQACDPGILFTLGAEEGMAAGTPALDPETGPCQLCPELPCIAACPSGALAPIPLGAVRIGVAKLDESRCIAFHGQQCQVCLDVCPLPGKAIAIEAGKPRILEDLCTGCGVCSFACVAYPTAIRIEHAA